MESLPSGLRQKSAKLLFVGSNPTDSSNVKNRRQEQSYYRLRIV